ncbi:uncharacterized protein ACA1_052280 [Acanthamoeba castellanii str. Neff]|uniref:PAS domain-containing protein n=1 Tax=Acanthamoeba castellanii (strain ATCC 30010 / Neff) TaxID=1257118 RepID=L8H4V1_ACACF|nr:uncharacterized protein ACA1_052280 [Acanthamoeba castellanii str. Neff]ELR20539.1 hypothetical protein ACA1_052280 [Acanthamoeba castellanii str. Neff]
MEEALRQVRPRQKRATRPCSLRDVPPRKRSRTLADGFSQPDAGDGGETGSPSFRDDLHLPRDAEEEAKPNRKRNRTKKNKNKDININVNDKHIDDGTTTTSAALVVHPPQLVAIEQKFDLVTQLLHTMAGEMKQMRHTHDALFVELRQTQDQLRSTDAVVAELLRREQKRADDKQRRSAEKERKKHAQTQTQTQTQTSVLVSTTSSSSPISSPSLALGPGPRSSFSFELSMLQSGVSPAVVLEARQQLPWLCHYDISPNRFAILDFTRPVYVCEKLSSLEVPSFISYVNAAFVRMSQYSWSELIGMPFSKIFTGHERYLSQFAALLYNQPPMTPGIVFSYSPLMRRKDGQLIRLKDRSQAFYNHHGQAQYSVKCIVGWEESSLREGEGFDRWVPPRPRVDAPPLGDSAAGPGSAGDDSSPIDNATLVLEDEILPRPKAGGGITLIPSTTYPPALSSSSSLLPSSSSPPPPSSSLSPSRAPPLPTLGRPVLRLHQHQPAPQHQQHPQPHPQHTQQQQQQQQQFRMGTPHVWP